jgi:ParB family chromosome partitioning protein
MKKQSLGRGLGAILGEIEDAYEKEISSGTSRATHAIEIAKITPNPYQPRQTFDKDALQELSESIKAHGLIQPILVASKDGGDSYIIIAGERRFRATKMLGEKTINAVTIEYDVKKLFELAIIENIQREELNPIELASSYQQLIDEYQLTQEELSIRLHKSRTLITNTLRLLKLSGYVQDLLATSQLSAGHAKVMVPLDETMQKRVADQIVAQNLSVREAESLIKQLKKASLSKNKNLTPTYQLNSRNIKLLNTQLKELGLHAKVSKNKITLSLENDSDFQLISQLLQK